MTVTDPAARRVLEVFLAGARQITDHARFTRHRTDGQVDWNGVLAEPGWSTGQRALIQTAAVLCGAGPANFGALGAHLTGPQCDLVLAMCRAAYG
jgi:hypothetical protein